MKKIKKMFTLYFDVKIEGAENHLIKGFSHYRMPRNPSFLFKLMEVVKTANASV